jgi:hypothetical protein
MQTMSVLHAVPVLYLRRWCISDTTAARHPRLLAPDGRQRAPAQRRLWSATALFQLPSLSSSVPASCRAAWQRCVLASGCAHDVCAANPSNSEHYMLKAAPSGNLRRTAADRHCLGSHSTVNSTHLCRQRWPPAHQQQCSLKPSSLLTDTSTTQKYKHNTYMYT